MIIQRYLWIFALFIFLFSAVLLSCSKSTKTVDDEDTDSTPPDVVSDLAIVDHTSQTATLRWTTPMDHRDDQSGGMVDGYDLRISYDSITAANFAAAYQIDDVPGPLPAGQIQTWVIDSLTPDSTYYFAIKSVDDKGNWSGISNCPMVHCPAIQVVTFADSALEQAIRTHIHKPTGPILSTDVDTIWQVVVDDAGVSSLVGMEYFTSLIVANFSWNDISDLSPLSGLAHLAGVYVGGNNISDISPLQGMTTLRQIHLSDNPITDISPLASIDSLQQLILWNTNVTDFSPLYDLYFLSDVGFNGMNLTDISFMSHLRRPQLCGLAFNNISDLTPLEDLYMLESLDLMQNHISDIDPLTPLTNLRELRLANNQITDIMALINNTGIDSGDVVYLEGNPLSQYAINTEIPTLEARGVVVHH